MYIPKVFISYSWDNEEHKDWVLKLADTLLEEGINAVVDQYDVEPGDRLPHFMEKSIKEADKVLIICTPEYKRKSNERTGGVGYESHIISEELYSQHNERKFIPILRLGTFEMSMPVYLAGKLGIDLRADNKNYENSFNDLLTTIRGEHKKPPINTEKASQNKPPVDMMKKHSEETDEPIRITGIITDEVTLPRNDGTRGSALYKVPFRLSKRPSELWKELFLHYWDSPLSFTTMHRPGIASVYGDKIVLNGTTIEEVQKYHRDTLVQCVDVANKKEKELIEKQKAEEERKKQIEEQHRRNVEDISRKIKF